MKISARLENSPGTHEVVLQTGGASHTIGIPSKETGLGSKTNGGELLFLALATCYCNDLYREAAGRGIAITRIEVEVDGDFGGPGEPARGVSYRARVEADATEEEIRDLMVHTDRVTEIQNSLRLGTPVTLAHVEAIPSGSR